MDYNDINIFDTNDKDKHEILQTIVCDAFFCESKNE